MASYTDKIPTFNPYVEQQPVDAMLKVGMYKQQKYEEGVKKIQTNIDNVAGLDIANDVQQKYLQSKLNALGNNLTFFAASDFSDFSLVNSVNGMTKQITKDEDIINAVSSTAKLRAGYKKKAELAKKGLTDKNNDDYYDMYASEYVDSKDLKASFNSDYIPHTNIVKKLQEALKEAGQSTTIAEEIFVTDPNTGKPMIGPDGHYMYADAKAIEKIVTNKPAVIAAINGVMNEGDVKQQLAIDGWATYRNTEATELLEPLKTQFDSERSRLEAQSVEVSALLSSTNLSEEQKEMYTKVASDIESAILKNDQSFMSMSKDAEDNPESFKQNFYIQETKQRLMNQFVKEEVSNTYGTNEALQQQNWRQDYAFKEKQEKDKIAYQNENLKLAKEASQREGWKFLAEYGQDLVTAEWYKKPTPGSDDSNKKKPVTANPIFSGGTPGDKVSAININQKDVNLLSTTKKDLAFNMYADIIRLNKDDASLSDEAILKSVNTFAKQSGVTPEQFLDRWANNIANKYVELGLTPPADLFEQIDKYQTTAKNLKNRMAMTTVAQTDADKESGVNKELLDVLKDKRTLNFNVNGAKITVTPREMLGLISTDVERLFKMFNKAGQRELLARKDLTTGQRQLIANWDVLPREMRDTVMKEFGSYVNGNNNITTYKKTIDKSNKLFNEKLSKIVGVDDAITQSMSNTTDETKAAIGNISTYISGAEARNYGKDTDRTKVIAALGRDPQIGWKARKPTTSGEDWTGEIKITDKETKEVLTITNLSRTDLEGITGRTFQNYVEKPIDDLITLNVNTKSTNSKYMVNSPDAWRTSYFKENEVNPEIVKLGWGYRADVIKATGGYRLVNYVKAPGKNKYTTIYGAFSKDEYSLDRGYKLTTAKELENIYMSYLQYQNK
jgi:hypothetical protein